MTTPPLLTMRFLARSLAGDQAVDVIMSNTIERYLATLEKGLRARVSPERLRSLKSEIADHLNSKKQDLIQEGMDEEKAEREAIEGFGRPYVVIESELRQHPSSSPAIAASRLVVTLIAALTTIQLSFVLGRPILPGNATLFVTIAGMGVLFGASFIAQRVQWRLILLSIPIFVLGTGAASTTERYNRSVCSLGNSVEYAVADRAEMRQKTAEIKSQAISALTMVDAGEAFFVGPKPRFIPSKFRTPNGHLLELPVFGSLEISNPRVQSAQGKGPYLLNFSGISELQSYRFDSTDSWNAACALWHCNAPAWRSNLNDIVEATPCHIWLRGVNYWLYLLSIVMFWLISTLVPNLLGVGLGRVAGKISRRIRYA